MNSNQLAEARIWDQQKQQQQEQQVYVMNVSQLTHKANAMF